MELSNPGHPGYSWNVIGEDKGSFSFSITAEYGLESLSS